MPEQTLQPSELSAPKLRPTAEFPSIFSSRTAWEIKQISIGWFVAMNLVDLNLVDLWDCITYFFLNQTAVPISQVSSSENCQQSLLKILRCTVSSFNQNGQKNKIETKSNQIQYKMTLHSLILSKQCVFSWHQAWDVSFPNGFSQSTMKKKMSGRWQESKTKFETNVVESVLNQVMWVLGFICAMLGKTSMNFHPFLGIWTLSGWFSRETTKNCLKTLKISFGGIPNSRNVLFLPIFLQHSAKPSAGNTSACSKASQTFSETFSGTLHQSLPEPSAEPSLHQSLPGLLRNLLLHLRNPFNLTWLCTKVPGTFSGTFSRSLLNLTWVACSLPPMTCSLVFVSRFPDERIVADAYAREFLRGVARFLWQGWI